MIKIVFYGIDEFAATILERICNNSDFLVFSVITQPDRPSGRNRDIIISPVKNIANKFNLEILQPETLKDFDATCLHNADIAVVAEYGMIIPERLLSLPAHGTVNLHGSILPKYRGASPIQSAILNGDNETGVTLMLMDKKMDHGPVIATANAKIDKDEMFSDLYNRLSELAADLFIEQIGKYINGEIKPVEQNHAEATYCKILSRDDGKIDFQKDGTAIFNQYRAYTPWPGIWCICGDKRLKIGILEPSGHDNLAPGSIFIHENRIYVGCGNHTSIEVKKLQMEGKKMLDAADFLRGERDFASVRFN